MSIVVFKATAKLRGEPAAYTTTKTSNFGENTHSISDHEGEVVRVSPATAFHSQGYVDMVHLIIAVCHLKGRLLRFCATVVPCIQYMSWITCIILYLYYIAVKGLGSQILEFV